MGDFLSYKASALLSENAGNSAEVGMETERPTAIMARSCRARRPEPPRFYCSLLAASFFA
jgi:hypothetical protein